jgi:hypothetical protein
MIITQTKNKIKYDDNNYLSVPSHIRINIYFTKDDDNNVIIDNELMTDELNVDLQELNKIINRQINRIKEKEKTLEEIFNNDPQNILNLNK